VIKDGEVIKRRHFGLIQVKLTDIEDEGKIGDHLANERTYLAWVRTGITVMALGFVVAKFGLIVRELAPSSVTLPSHVSSIVGIVLVLIGAILQGLALRRFRKNRMDITQGKFRPDIGIENLTSSLMLLVSVMLIIYLIITS
jgi:putative membrane protein